MRDEDLKELWERVLALWGHPRLPDPQFHRTKDTAPPQIRDEIEAIDLTTKVVHAVLPTIDEYVGIDCLEAIVAHGVGHHTSCPFDILTGVRLTYEAGHALGDRFDAGRHLAHIFAEWVVNTDLYLRGTPTARLLVTALQRQMAKDPASRSWAFYHRVYERLLGLPEGAIVKKQPDKDVDADARKVHAILRDGLFTGSSWVDKIRKAAPVMEKYFVKYDQCDQPDDDGRRGEPAPARKDSAKAAIKPCAVLQTTTKEELEKALAQLAREIGQAPFIGLAGGVGVGDPHRANRLFYRGRAEQYAVPLPLARTQAGELFKHTPTAWQPSDPVDRLDIPYSLQQHGELIAGMTTKQWQYDQNTTFNESRDRPDVIILQDSSGSMQDPTRGISWSVIGSLVIAYSALKAGTRVGVMNFSYRCRVLEPCRNREEIEDELLLFQGGGTNSPTDELVRLMRQQQKPTHIYYCSDTHLANPAEAIPALEQAVRLGNAGGTIFLAGEATAVSTALRKAGYNVHRLTDDADLVRIAASTAEGLYR